MPTFPALSPEQLEAVGPRPGVTVVIGGPGTGKTQALSSAVARLVDGGTALSRVAVLAGSRAAAQAIRRDVIARVGRAQASPAVTTVHGLALGLLREFEPDDEEPWTLLRAPQQEERIRELLARPRAEWPRELHPALVSRAFARQLREVLARVRQRSWDEVQLAALAREHGDETLAAIADFLDEYLSVGDLEHTIDYAELVYRVRLLLRDEPLAEAVKARFEAVFVDDAHDLDLTQAGLLADFARLGLPLVAFGDPQQEVSGFRGATARGLDRLLEVRPSRRVELRRSHRHNQALVVALEDLRRRIDARGAAGGLRAGVDAPGEVRVRVYDDDAAETAHVADQLRAGHAEGLEWGDMAVIARAGRAQLAPITRALGRLGVPVEVAADELVLAEEESVVALLLALRTAEEEDPPDADRARLLLTSELGGLDAIGLRALARALSQAHGDAGPSDALLARSLVEPGLLEGLGTPEAAHAMRLAALLAGADEALERGERVPQVLWALWDGTDWPERLKAAALERSQRANHQLDAVVELFERAGREPVRAGRQGAFTFIRDLAGEEIPADTGRELAVRGAGVQVTTAHRAKGRQWRRVWVVGATEGRWPRTSPPSLVLDPSLLLDRVPRTVAEHLQQERRLFYLACSRASTHLSVSAPRDAGQLSRFAHELGEPVTEVPGMPDKPLTGAALVGELRRTLLDEEASLVLRRAAALRLPRLQELGVESANPGNWWGLGGLSSPAPEPGEEIVLSSTAVVDLLTCPRRYFLSRRAGARPPRSSSASIGDVVHLIAQHAQRDDLDAGAVREELDEVWDRIPFETAWLGVTQRAEVEEGVTRLVAWLRERRDVFLAAEQRFRIPVAVGGRSVLLHGVADRVELLGRGSDAPRLRVVDFKTGRRPKSSREVARDIQLGFYQLAAREGAFEAIAPGVRDVDAPALLYLRVDAGGAPKMMEQSSLAVAPTLDDEELEVGPTWMHDRIAEAVDVLAAGEFPAVRNPECGYCPFREGCPAFEGDGR